MEKSLLVAAVKNGRNVKVALADAEIVFVKREARTLWKGSYAYGVSSYKKFIVKDPVYGSVYFSSSSDKLWNLNKGDKISLEVTFTGVGDPSERYPDPILFAKANTRKRDSVRVVPHVDASNDSVTHA